jgi:hypothetical protein
MFPSVAKNLSGFRLLRCPFYGHFGMPGPHGRTL